MKDPLTRSRDKRNNNDFQSEHIPRIVLFLQFEDDFHKVKDNNLESTMGPNLNNPNASVDWNLFGWIT